MEKEKELLTVEETANYLKISTRTIYNGICKNSKYPFPVKPKRIGSRVRFLLKDLNKYIDSI